MRHIKKWPPPRNHHFYCCCSPFPCQFSRPFLQLRRHIHSLGHFLNNNSLLHINRPDQPSQHRQLHPKHSTRHRRRRAADRHRPCRPNSRGQPSGQQTSKRHHPHEGHPKKAHYPPAHPVLHDRLQNRIARCEKGDHRKAHQHHRHHRHP